MDEITAALYMACVPVAIVWLLLPFIIMRKVNETNRLLQLISDQLKIQNDLEYRNRAEARGEIER